MTSISKNVYHVKRYNNNYHTSTKMKPVDVKDNTLMILKKKSMIKILNLKLVIT